MNSLTFLGYAFLWSLNYIAAYARPEQGWHLRTKSSHGVLTLNKELRELRNYERRSLPYGGTPDWLHSVLKSDTYKELYTDWTGCISMFRNIHMYIFICTHIYKQRRHIYVCVYFTYTHIYVYACACVSMYIQRRLGQSHEFERE